MGKEAGMKSEWFFCDLLKEKGIAYTFTNDWYDFLVKDKKVEVKSCQLSIKKGKNYKKYIGNKGKSGKYTVGKFDFKDEEQRERLIKENVWICLIVRHKLKNSIDNENQFIVYGFIRAEQLSNKRLLSIHQARDLEPISFEDGVLELYGK